MSQHHIVLLGDSILDNDPYVAALGGPSVTQQLLCSMEQGGRVTKLARDGAVMSHVTSVQLSAVPADATALVLSCGGNDGLRALAQLRERGLWTTGTTFFAAFRRDYECMVDCALRPGLPLILCTIYQPQMGHHGWFTDTFISCGVRLLNRIIRAVAAEHALPLLDLWTIFDRRADYANPIEPGVPGGHKLVRNIVAWAVRDHCMRSVNAIYDDARYDIEFDLAAATRFDNTRHVAVARQ